MTHVRVGEKWEGVRWYGKTGRVRINGVKEGIRSWVWTDLLHWEKTVLRGLC